jgi:hypothetical protein
MDSAFFQEGVGDYEQALQDYTNQMNREQIDEEAEEKPVDEFNSTLQEVGDPVGAALLHKPLLKLVKKGLEKTLGRVAKTGQEVAGDAAKKLASGDVRGAARTVARGAQGAVDDAAAAARQAASDLGDVAKNAAVQARSITQGQAQRLGVRAANPKSPSAADPEQETSTIDDSRLPLDDFFRRPTGSDLLGEEPPSLAETSFGEPTEADAFASPDLDAVASRLGTTSDKLATGTTDDLFSALNQDVLARGGTQLFPSKSVTQLRGGYSESLGDAQRAAKGFQQGDATIARATGQSGSTPPQQSDAIADDAARPAQAAAGEGDQQAGGALRQAVQETQTGGAGGAEASTAADASLEAGGGAAADLATQTAAPITEGLTTAAEGASVAAGAEGGLNPFADIGAAILGLASILGVTFGGKHAQHESDPEFIPSAQFGI